VVAEGDPAAPAADPVSQASSGGEDSRARRAAAQAEMADLRARLERAEALVEHAPDAVVILDVDAGRFVSVNAAAEQLFGLARSGLLRVGPV
jgi:PAS domain-containing protein